MSAAFTPGPWGYSFVKQDTGFEGDTFMAGPLGDEGGFSSVVEGGLVLADDNENEANARLIAAAPELYEALETCLAMAQRKSLTSPLNLNGQSPYDIGIAALRKARDGQ